MFSWEERMSLRARDRQRQQYQLDREAMEVEERHQLEARERAQAYDAQVTDEDFAFALYWYLSAAPATYSVLPERSEDYLRHLLATWLEYHPGYDFTPIAFGATA